MKTIAIVPCFNEAPRLDGPAFVDLARELGGVVFVDDASTDSTPLILSSLADDHPDLIQVVQLDRNSGKGEAVRRGILVALAKKPDAVGYLDADLATSTDEFSRLAAVLAESDGLDAAIGSRVALAGRQITRHASRHYLGRVYATLASAVLGEAVYDTQCGAKIFVVTPTLVDAVGEPFANRWSFDVELLGRLMSDEDFHLREIPLEEWTDVAGSKIDLRASLVATWSLWAVRRRLSTW